MTDIPWSNRQQQMVQEYLDALLTDPEVQSEQNEAVAQVSIEQSVSEEIVLLEEVVDIATEPAAEENLLVPENTDNYAEAELEPETVTFDTAADVDELSAEMADDGQFEMPASDTDVSLPVEELLENEVVSAESMSVDIAETELTAPDQETEGQLEDTMADDVVECLETESLNITEGNTVEPGSEAVLEAALHAIESVQAAEETEETEELDDSEAVLAYVPEAVIDIPEDVTAEDGVSTLSDPISVAAELLHEELNQYDADPFEGTVIAEELDVLQDIPEIATEPQALLPVGDSAVLDVEDPMVDTLSASSDLDAYVEDISNMPPVVKVLQEEHHEDHDVAALLSQLAEIVSDDSVAEAVIRKIEEIAQEFSANHHVTDVFDSEILREESDEVDVAEDILETVDAVIHDEDISFDLGEDDTENSADSEPLSEDELAAEFAAAMAAEADEYAGSVSILSDELLDAEVSEIEFPTELDEIVSESEQSIEPEVIVSSESVPVEDMQCIIVEMHGLRLAMPLEHVLEPRHIADMSLVLDDQYDWVLGSFLDLNFKIDVVDTAMWLIPESYEPHNATYDEILLLQGKPWALTYDKMITGQVISMDEVTLNTDKTRRPWLLGTSMVHKCAIVDIPALCKQLEEAL